MKAIGFCLVFGLSCAVSCAVVSAAPSPARQALECTCIYGGEATTMTVEPTADRYGVAAVPIGSRFAFKAVYVASPAASAGINLYAYYVTAGRPVLLSQVKYRPPFPAAEKDALYGITGLHFVYEPGLESELQFWCGWRDR